MYKQNWMKRRYFMSNLADRENSRARSARLGFRATHEQQALIRRAAEITHKSVTEFVLDSACEAAANALLDQRLFLVDDEAWQKFQDALDEPAKVKPKLQKLIKEKARTFYQKFDFEQSPLDPLHLMLLLKDAKKTVEDIKS
jgi:uncharacterized protein (DUF1778 family)